MQADDGHPAGTVPWHVNLKAWAEYGQPVYPGHDGRFNQSAEGIAARGGFGYREMQCLLAGHYNVEACRRKHPDIPGWEPQ